MSDTRTYTGGCHCGRVRYEVTTDLSQVIACNCSICMKRGYVLTFVGPEQIKVLSGAEGLTDYQFGKKTVHHTFCPVCGVGSYGHGTMPDGKTMYAVNVRCLEDVDISGLTVTPFDGKSL